MRSGGVLNIRLAGARARPDNRKVIKAVQTSMRIEGCKPAVSVKTKAQAKALMELQRGQVSVPGKCIQTIRFDYTLQVDALYIRFNEAKPLSKRKCSPE